MAIKIIKFDLPINGTKVTTLEALRDNLTDEIVQLARSGQLERWFKSRKLDGLAQAVAGAVADHAEDKALFMALCAVLEVEVHLEDVNTIFDASQEAGWHIRDEKYLYIKRENIINIFDEDFRQIYTKLLKITDIFCKKSSEISKMAVFDFDMFLVNDLDSEISAVEINSEIRKEIISFQYNMIEYYASLRSKIIE